MIKRTDNLTFEWLPLIAIRVYECQPRFLERVLHYVRLLTDNPELHTGPISVSPDPQHDGLFMLDDGHHRFVAHIITGRTEIAAIVNRG